VSGHAGHSGAYPLGRMGTSGLVNMAPVNRAVSGIFGGADTDTKFTRGLAVCALTAVHVAASGALLHVAGGSVAMAAACLVVLVVLLAAQCAVLLGGTGQLVFVRSEMETIDGKAQMAVKAAQEGVGPVALSSLLDFWLLFTALLLSLGAGVTVINNLSQMVGAYAQLAPTAGMVTHSLLKLLACMNTLGRLASGALSDRLAARVSRVMFTVYCVAGMAAGQAFLSVGVSETAPLFGLVVGVSCVGWMYGSLFWAMPTLVMELFGAKHFGANRGLVGLSPAIGGYLLSTLLAGKVYAAAAGEDNNCVAGGACYRTTWTLNAGLGCCAVAGFEGLGLGLGLRVQGLRFWD